MNKEKLEEFNKIYTDKKNEILSRNEKIRRLHELYNDNEDVKEFYSLLKDFNLSDVEKEIDENDLYNYASFNLRYKSNDLSSSHIYVYHGMNFTKITDGKMIAYYSSDDTLFSLSNNVQNNHWFQDLETGDYIVKSDDEFSLFIKDNNVICLDKCTYYAYCSEKMKYIKCEFIKLCNDIGIDNAISVILSKYGYEKKEC